MALKANFEISDLKCYCNSIFSPFPCFGPDGIDLTLVGQLGMNGMMHCFGHVGRTLALRACAVCLVHAVSESSASVLGNGCMDTLGDR